MFLLKLISRLPLSVLYRLADFLYFISCYVVRYRKKVVLNNLKGAFPEKSEKEIQEIAKGFYKNFADIVVEIIKGFTISEKELKKRIIPTNLHIADRYFDQQVSFIAMVSHMCNWEWIGLGCSVYLRAKMVVIYKKQSNKKIDKFMREVRSVFGALPIDKNHVLKQLVKMRNTVSGIGVIADQSPARSENRYWRNFLNQETAFFTGGEKMARKFKYPVVYINMRRIKRGYYELFFDEIAEPPFDGEENYILANFAEKLEQDIRRNPSDWLWSHKRWKFKKPSDIDSNPLSLP